MKKIYAIIAIAAVMSCVCVCNAFANMDYVITVGTLRGSICGEKYSYRGATYGEYKERIDKIKEDEQCDNSCIIYFCMTNNNEDNFVMIVGKNLEDEEEMVLWKENKSFWKSLNGHVEVLRLYDAFMDAYNEGTKLIVVNEYENGDYFIVDNSDDALKFYESEMRVINLIDVNLIKQ